MAADAKFTQITADFASIQAQAEAVTVHQFLTRADAILDELELDSLDRMTRLMFDLSSIEKILNQHNLTQEFAEIQRDKNNMLLVISSIKQYKDRKFDAVVTTLDVVPDDVLNKHRVMQGAYHKLYIRAHEAGRNDDAKRFLEQIERHAQEYQRLARHSNKKSYISKVNLAGARILAGKYADAREILHQAIVEQPYESVAYYNLAALDALQEKLDPALTELEKAKERGDISTEVDIQYFLNDPDFQKLHNSDDPDIKTRLRHLLRD